VVTSFLKAAKNKNGFLDSISVFLEVENEPMCSDAEFGESFCVSRS
jgi:hypothetical protein